MSFLEIFQPGLKHPREARDRQKMLGPDARCLPAINQLLSEITQLHLANFASAGHVRPAYGTSFTGPA